MKSRIDPILAPGRGGNSSSSVARTDQSDEDGVSISHHSENIRKHPSPSIHLRFRPDVQPPARKTFLTGLTQAFANSRQKRHDSKVLARGHVQSAMNLLQKDEDRRQEAHDHLNQLIKHCGAYRLDLEHELSRATPSAKHPLTQMLDWGDYDSLAILAPALKSSNNGSTLVRRTSDGIYVGQGVRRPGGSSEVVLAHGSGLFMGADGRRVEGRWCDDNPANVTLYPEAGPMEFTRGAVKDGQWNGKCLTRFKNGGTFLGHWESGEFHGSGVLTMADGSVLRGIWRKNMLLPGARYQMRDGRIYHGDINLDAGNVRGSVAIAWSAGQKCGALYEGLVEDNEPHGMGRYTFSPHEEWSGYVYDGPWLDGKKHGAGILTRMVDNQRFDCAFTNDILHK